MILMAAAVMVAYFMMFYVSAAVARTSPAYMDGVKQVSTHVLEYVTDFKNTVTDIDTARELLKRLPMCEQITDVQYTDGTLAVTYADVEEAELKRAVVYNSTMIFALQDHLLKIEWTINADKYIIPRAKVTMAYEHFVQILDGSVWMAELKKPIMDDTAVEKMFTVFTG